MNIVNGQKYTFHFSVKGGWVSTGMGVEPLGTHFASDLTSAGFPVSWVWDGVSQDINLHGDGMSDLSFIYNGTSTDDTTLGNAMQDAINAAESVQVNYESADTGNTTTGIANQTAQALPSPSTFGVALVAVLLLAVGIYSFAGHAAERI